MSVYVDDMFANLGRMKMCHMIADTSEELHGMAQKIGVARRWVQHPSTPTEHYDVCKEKRERAVRLGAKEITLKEVGLKIRERRSALAETSP